MKEGVRYESVSDTILVEFSTYRISNAKVIWINKRYFASLGYDVTDPEMVKKIEADILDQFGVSSLPISDPNEHLRRVLKADRYGGSEGTVHGGSGRCGVNGMLNAKGIGPTPLVSPGQDWSYSHGSLYLYEALSEAVAAEISVEELPAGSVPIIAIVDAAYSIAHPELAAPERCAIYIRPNFLRASHFERSIFFGNAGTAESDQFVDAARVRDVHRHVYGEAGAADAFLRLNSVFEQFVRQIASSRCNRLWNGRATTGNLTIQGSFFDYGAFRALPNWAKGSDGHGQVFGLDAVDIERNVKSLCFYFNKFQSPPLPGVHQLAILAALIEKLDEIFSELCASMIVDPDAHFSQALKRDLKAESLRYYRAQQRSSYELDDGANSTLGWVYDRLRLDTVCKSDDEAGRLFADVLCEAAQEHGNTALARAQALCRIRRWLMPRPTVYYRELRASAKRCVANYINSEGDRGIIEQYINRSVERSRRQWPQVPANRLIVGYSRTDVEDIVVTHDVLGYDAVYIAPFSNGRFILQGEWADLDSLSQSTPSIDMERGRCAISRRELAMSKLGPTLQKLGKPHVIFDDALSASVEFSGTPPWQ